MTLARGRRCLFGIVAPVRPRDRGYGDNASSGGASERRLCAPRSGAGLLGRSLKSPAPRPLRLPVRYHSNAGPPQAAVPAHNSARPPSRGRTWTRSADSRSWVSRTARATRFFCLTRTATPLRVDPGGEGVGGCPRRRRARVARDSGWVPAARRADRGSQRVSRAGCPLAGACRRGHPPPTDRATNYTIT